MIRFLTVFMLFSIIGSPVLAQQETEVKEPSVKEKIMDKIESLKSDGDEKDRLELSKKMHEIWPIRQKIENALDVISQRLPQQERLKFKGAMRRSFDFDVLEKASIDAMADIFSEKELEKMIDFYGSKEGRSVSHKTSDYERALQPVIVKMMDKALLNAKMGSPESGAHSTPKK